MVLKVRENPASVAKRFLSAMTNGTNWPQKWAAIGEMSDMNRFAREQLTLRAIPELTRHARRVTEHLPEHGFMTRRLVADAVTILAPSADAVVALEDIVKLETEDAQRNLFLKRIEILKAGANAGVAAPG